MAEELRYHGDEDLEGHDVLLPLQKPEPPVREAVRELAAALNLLGAATSQGGRSSSHFLTSTSFLPVR
jgi:hypothetical protein